MEIDDGRLQRGGDLCVRPFCRDLARDRRLPGGQVGLTLGRILLDSRLAAPRPRTPGARPSIQNLPVASFAQSPILANRAGWRQAAGDMENWWQPSVSGPPKPRRGLRRQRIEVRFKALGFEPRRRRAGTGLREAGPLRERPARHSRGTAATRREMDQQARQGGDIEHDNPEVVAGGLYGEVVAIMTSAIGATSGAAV